MIRRFCLLLAFISNAAWAANTLNYKLNKRCKADTAMALVAFVLGASPAFVG